MSEFNFKSQICTSRVQSERLLALGLQPETADMAYRTTGKVVDMGEVRWMYQHNPSVVYKGMMCKEDIPAWSLHRLLELNLLCCEQHFAFQFHITNIDNAYEYLINHTEWLIKEGYSNKEYLEEQV